MSRARNIKPGFFKNDKLAECHPLARILFAGLWCEADREGRMEDRPRRLKAEYLPYDDCDIDALLNDLAVRGFIVRYQVGRGQYIQVIAFGKHQNPHVREPASQIPPPDEHRASTVLAPDEAQPCIGSAGLIPDSPSLIPDSMKSTDAYASESAAAKKPPAADPCPHTEIIAAYHEILPELPRVRSWDGDRQTLLRTRWRSAPERRRVEWWREFFEYVRRCPFLLGQVESAHRDPFLADLEWLIRPKNFRKVIEGKYEARNAA